MFPAPSNKWLSAFVTGIGTIVVMALSTNGWNTEEWIALVGFLVERSTAYLVPNQPPVVEGG